MFDNIAFSVVIGLVFIYLLYSLLTTILGEIISGWLKIRPGMLRTAIERMLNDGYYADTEKKTSLRMPGAVKSFFMVDHPAFKTSLAGKFYDYPSIKFLSRAENEKLGAFGKQRPAYISAETFALTLINMLAEKGMGADKMAQIVFALKVNSLHIQPETLKHISVILDNASGDYDKFKTGLMQWFEETMDRTTGWYKKKFSRILFWLGFLIAFTYNVDSIRIARILANDKDARSQLVTMGVALAKDSSRYKDFVTVNGDSIKTKAVLDTGYSRVTKDISNASLILGLGWSLDTLTDYDDIIIEKDTSRHTHADSAGAVKKIEQAKHDARTDSGSLAMKSDSPKQAARADSPLTGNKPKTALKDSTHAGAKEDSSQYALVYKAALAYSQQIDSGNLLIQRIVINRRSVDSLRQAASFQQITVSSLRTYGSTPEKIMNQDSILRKMQDSLNEASRQIFLDSFRLAGVYRRTQTSLKLLNTLSGTDFSIVQFVDTVTKKGIPTVYIGGRVKFGVWHKIWYFIKHISPFKASFWGILITALMLSLGAPFWFGVLNKLVSLRSAGVKPEEKSPVPDLVATAALAPPAGIIVAHSGSKPAPAPVDPAETVWNAFSNAVQHEQGIVSIALEGHPALIAVRVSSQPIVNYLSGKYGNTYTTAGLPALNVSYRVDNPNTAHAGTAGGRIANKNFQTNQGTMGGYLTKTGSDKLYVMSCWHVMKDNTNLEEAIVERTILDVTPPAPVVPPAVAPAPTPPPVIATVEDGFFSAEAGIDIGIAVSANNTITNVPGFAIKGQHRLVDAFDSLSNCPVTLLGAASGLQSATIFHYKSNVRITYPGGKEYLVKDVFSLVQTNAAGISKAPTQGGDSGAIVIDGNGIPLGMIIGGNGNLSYAIKFTNIFTNAIHSFGLYSF